MKVLLSVIVLLAVAFFALEHLCWRALLVNYGFTDGFAKKIGFCLALRIVPFIGNYISEAFVKWLDKSGKIPEYYQYENYRLLKPFADDMMTYGREYMIEKYLHF